MGISFTFPCLFLLPASSHCVFTKNSYKDHENQKC